MIRIIAFEGCDCVGKSTTIEYLIKRLKALNYKPIVFHLAGPNEEEKDFFNFNNFPGINKNDLGTIIQYEKFYQMFKMIQPILDSDPYNIIILDRTPFSELVWSPFFNRESKKYSSKKLMDKFLKLFENIKSQMMYIELTASSEILVDRIILKEEDYLNFINAFNNLKDSTNKKYEYINPNDPDSAKILYMINFIKEQYESVKLLLRNNGIFSKTFLNNNNEDMFNIVDYILNNFIIK